MKQCYKNTLKNKLGTAMTFFSQYRSKIFYYTQNTEKIFAKFFCGKIY